MGIPPIDLTPDYVRLGHIVVLDKCIITCRSYIESTMGLEF